jgi:Tol biopolymer transport system component
MDGDYYMSWAEKGKRIVFDARKAGQRHSIFSVSASGGKAKVIEITGNMPSVSPDGLKIAFMRGAELFIHTQNSTEKLDINVNASALLHPHWSPDSKQIVFTAIMGENPEIMIIALGEKDPVQITDNPAADDRACWSPDGKSLVFNSDRSGNIDLWLYNIEKKTLKQLTFDESEDLCATWSPDGKKIAFTSKRDNGNLNVWILDVSDY